MVRIWLTLHSALALLLILPSGSNASGSRQELGMQFTRHPQPLAAPLGDVVDFECSLGLAADKFTWRHRPLNSNQWFALTNSTPGVKKTSKLVIDFNDPSKSGDYRCIAYYGTSGLASDPGRLSLAKIDEFTDKSNVEIIVPAGNTVPITCPVPFSSPDPIVQFYKDSVLIKSRNLAGGKTLVLENAQPMDSGSYHCVAYNDIATQTVRSNHETKLIIQKDERAIPPFFVKQPQTEYKVLRGRNVTLECFGAARPIPKVTWSRLVGSLPSGSQYTSSGLMLTNVLPQDQGEYHCMWTSGGNKIESVIILKVVAPPRVTKVPKASTFAEGGELELFCEATGHPEPTIEWLINGEPLQRSPNVESKGSRLFVSSVEKKHAGIVQCVASNEYGSHSGYNFLRVNPKQHPGGSGDHSKQEGHGVPGGLYKHIRMGGKRKSKEGHRRGTVMVPPHQPNVTRLSDFSVMVRWSVPENTGLPILFFKVQYKEFGSKSSGKQSKWMTANMEIPNHVRSFEVNDLQPNSFYRFRIAAVYSNNDNKLSPNSVKFHLTKGEGFESNKMPIPLLTNTEALGPDRVLLIWQNPDRSVDIDGFYVNHRASTTAGDYIKTTVEGKNSTNITISYLQPDTTYEFKVQSFSVGAASEFSKIIREKTLKAVTEPPRVETAVPDNVPKSTGNGQSGSLYAIIGGALGGAALLGVMGAIVVVYKRSSIKQNRDASQNQGKHMTNGRVLNGGVTDSKINITSNPLAVLDTSETTQATNNMNSLPKVRNFISLIKPSKPESQS
uniref:Interference hedgehog n=1 Tax=Fopius arisanus TaxID=64838 RepID=A0A0C9QTS6_9HYME